MSETQIALQTRGIMAHWIRPRLLEDMEVRILQDIYLPLGIVCRMRIVPGLEETLWSYAEVRSEQDGLLDRLVFEKLMSEGKANLFPVEIAGFGRATLQFVLCQEDEGPEREEVLSES